MNTGIEIQKSPFVSGDRIKRIDQSPKLQGEVDYIDSSGRVWVVWDVAGRWPINPERIKKI